MFKNEQMFSAEQAKLVISTNLTNEEQRLTILKNYKSYLQERLMSYEKQLRISKNSHENDENNLLTSEADLKLLIAKSNLELNAYILEIEKIQLQLDNKIALKMQAPEYYEKQQPKKENIAFGTTVTDISTNTITKFLDSVSKRYIDIMRKPSTWGGDIELGRIANCLNIEIIVHRNRVYNMAHPISPDAPNLDTCVVHLLLTNENNGAGHYTLLIKQSNNTFIPYSIAPNGNCMFDSCIQGANYANTKNYVLRPSTDEEIFNLRKHVCDRLTVAVNEAITSGHVDQDPIRSRFERLISCNDSDLEWCRSLLPFCDLRDEALQLRTEALQLRRIIVEPPTVIEKQVLEKGEKSMFNQYQPQPRQETNKRTREDSDITTSKEKKISNHGEQENYISLLKKEKVLEGLAKILDYLQNSSIGEIIIPKELLLPEEVKYLRDALQEALDINNTQEQGKLEQLQRDLVKACEEGHLNNVKNLIENQGADVVKADSRGIYPVQAAILNLKNNEVYKYLIELPRVRLENDWYDLGKQVIPKLNELKITSPYISFDGMQYKDFFSIKERLKKSLREEDYQLIEKKIEQWDDSWGNLTNNLTLREVTYYKTNNPSKSFFVDLSYILHLIESDLEKYKTDYNILTSVTSKRPCEIETTNFPNLPASEGVKTESYKMLEPKALLSEYYKNDVNSYIKASIIEQRHRELLNIIQNKLQENNLKIEERVKNINVLILNQNERKDYTRLTRLYN